MTEGDSTIWCPQFPPEECEGDVFIVVRIENFERLGGPLDEIVTKIECCRYMKPFDSRDVKVIGGSCAGRSRKNYGHLDVKNVIQCTDNMKGQMGKNIGGSGGRRKAAPPWSKFFHFHAVFRNKLAK